MDTALLEAVPFPGHSAQVHPGLAPTRALGTCLGLSPRTSDREPGRQGIDGGCNILFPGAPVAPAPAACLQSLVVPTGVS